MCVGPIILDDYYRIGIGSIDAVLRDQLLADLRLQRREFEIAGLIVLDHEVDRCVAKITYAVEKHDRSHIQIVAKKITGRISDSLPLRKVINSVSL